MKSIGTRIHRLGMPKVGLDVRVIQIPHSVFTLKAHGGDRDPENLRIIESGW